MSDYKFPDEEQAVDFEDFEIEITDDTPDEDKGKKPLPKEVVDELETADDSEDYSGNVKNKFKQYKKAWHDERRAKEEAYREQERRFRPARVIGKACRARRRICAFDPEEDQKKIYCRPGNRAVPGKACSPFHKCRP